MTQRPKILILANSHSVMLQRAIEMMKADGRLTHEAEAHWIKVDANGRRGELLVPDALNMVRELGPNDLLVVSLLGTLHNVFGIVQHEIPYTIGTDPEVGYPNERRQMLPTRLVEAWFRSVIERDGSFKTITAAAPCRVVHVMPPPPKEHLPTHLRPKPKHNAIEGKEYQFSDAALRLTLWKLEAEVLSQYLSEIGVTCIGVPPGVTDSRGFLRPEYYASDATHANRAYGVEVIHMLRGLLAIQTEAAKQETNT